MSSTAKSQAKARKIFKEITALHNKLFSEKDLTNDGIEKIVNKIVSKNKEFREAIEETNS